MSLVGIDVGTTGCKAAAFSQTGQMLAFAYEEYQHRSPQDGWAQIDACEVWRKVQLVIHQVAVKTARDPITALSVTSMGEAMVPVSENRQVLSPSILNYDIRGEEFLGVLKNTISPEEFYAITGNSIGNHFSLTKIMWIRSHQPEIFENTDKFLSFSGFIAFMLGAEPTIDYTLANRTLLFDIEQESWSSEILKITDLDSTKLPSIAASGTKIGYVSDSCAKELGLPRGVAIFSGAHDQCSNAVGCGAVQKGQALLGMGTFICAAVVFNKTRESQEMIVRGLNTEHHAVPSQFVTFVYNQGGSVVKWFRDTFALFEHQQSINSGTDIYSQLFSEAPDFPSRVVVLPTYTSTGLPDFNPETSGVIAGLRLNTTRGEILKGVAEGVIFDLKECLDDLPKIGIDISDFRVAGGGSKSDAWVQISADILDRPMKRPEITESGALGSAIIAGVGNREFSSYDEAVGSMVRIAAEFFPNQHSKKSYAGRFEKYLHLKNLLKGFLKDLMVVQ